MYRFININGLKAKIITICICKKKQKKATALYNIIHFYTLLSIIIAIGGSPIGVEG